MEILSLKRWERVSYEAAPGVFIHMKVKRLKRHEAKPLAKAIIKVFEQFEKAGAQELTKTQKAEILAQAFEVVPEEQLKTLFGDCVKEVEGLEIDGAPIQTGPALLEEADDSLLFWLLLQLHNLSKLTEAEGKGSPSRSTLRLVGEGAGVSPAQPTEHEGGAEPSTATETPIVEASSIARG